MLGVRLTVRSQFPTAGVKGSRTARQKGRHHPRVFRRRPTILRRQLLLATPVLAGEPGRHVADDERAVPVVAIGEENGLPVVPAFTSEREVGSWFNEATPYVGMSGDVVLRMLLTTPWSRLVIDPASQRPVEIDRAEAERLLNR